MAEFEFDFNQPVVVDINRFSAGDFQAFEQQTGMDLHEFAQLMADGKIHEGNYLKNLDPLVAFLWIGLRQKDRSITYEQVHEYAPLIGMMDAMEVIQPRRRDEPAAAAADVRRPPVIRE